MPGKRWSPKEIANLTIWYSKEGWPREAIANELHRTIFAIDNKIERMRLTRRRTVKEAHAEIAEEAICRCQHPTLLYEIVDTIPTLGRDILLIKAVKWET